MSQVIDFGSSCYENQRVYTYIQSRFYRAPEVILGAKYGMAIDMWSLGCILAELVTGFPLLPGEDEADQLACIIELLGMPPAELLAEAKRTRQFISSRGYPRYCIVTTMTNGSIMLSGGVSRRGKLRGPPGTKELKQVLKGCDDPLFLDFISRCLEWEPSLRMTPSAALKHAWLRRRLPKPPDENNDSLPLVPSAAPPPPPPAAGLRVPASGSRSSSKLIAMQPEEPVNANKINHLNNLYKSICTMYSKHYQSAVVMQAIGGQQSGQPSAPAANHLPGIGSHQSLNATSAGQQHGHQLHQQHNNGSHGSHGSSHDSHSSHESSSGSSRLMITKDVLEELSRYAEM
ncbi:hypothetical protein KM043_014437 [Ampulex compressa]|nr:hypothetical protein KM043_014437 [Ampulex compressa]